MVTFLILLNLTVWGAFTFGLQNPKTTVKEIKYYGSVPGSNEDDASIWIVIQRILIPVIIFFRFHTLVILVECWKNCYRSEVKFTISLPITKTKFPKLFSGRATLRNNTSARQGPK